MLKSEFFVLFCVFFNPVLLDSVGSGSDGNLRVCIVENRGMNKRATKFCPILDEEKSGVECVLGVDGLDCLRRMSKGSVDFGVFTPEDLIAAQWANIDVLVTNEIRYRDRKFMRSFVAVVDRRILPPSLTTVHDVLKNTTLCHRGHGDDMRLLTDTLAEYLESLVTDRSCDPDISLTENRIKAMSGFFAKACKAGPWVQDKARDAQLKTKYKNLCEACASKSCTTQDQYWGISGAFECLTLGGGDVAWADLDEVRDYFGLVPGETQYSKPDNYAYLCRDGTWQPLKDNPDPCVWINQPWKIVVAKRKAAEAVRVLTNWLTNSSVTVDAHWRGALAALLEINQALPEPIGPQKAPMDYLSQATGFREAYNRASCSPPRHITLCTTSIIEKNKCEWLSEAGTVLGVEPPLQCAYRESKEDCFKAIERGEVDTVVADSDWLVKALREYKIAPVLHETTPIVDQTSTVVVYVKSTAMLTQMSELRGKRAYFPNFDGLAWHSVSNYLSKHENMDCGSVIEQFFGDICAPGIEKTNMSAEVIARYTKNCYKDGENLLRGELQSLRALIEGNTDVAFLSLKTYNKYSGKKIDEPWTRNLQKIVPICPEENKKYCFLSWSNIGHVYASRNLTAMRRQEIINVFTQLDQMFGKYQSSYSTMFAMYAPFNYKSDILFHDNTKSLSTNAILKSHPYDKLPLNFERALSLDDCVFKPFNSFAFRSHLSMFVLITCLVSYFFS